MLRLKRIEGQIRGIQRLLQQGHDCKAVLQQISAARAALFRAGIHSAVANFRRCAYDGKGATTDFHEDIERFLETLEKFS
ncbi:MAG: metal-sensitive transcriptional regulator [Chloroflexi bacterium]|nr:metal-sensitive transcriptional regulator [Chloroflexota bacterium]